MSSSPVCEDSRPAAVPPAPAQPGPMPASRRIQPRRPPPRPPCSSQPKRHARRRHPPSPPVRASSPALARRLCASHDSLQLAQPAPPIPRASQQQHAACPSKQRPLLATPAPLSLITFSSPRLCAAAGSPRDVLRGLGAAFLQVLSRLGTLSSRISGTLSPRQVLCCTTLDRLCRPTRASAALAVAFTFPAVSSHGWRWVPPIGESLPHEVVASVFLGVGLCLGGAQGRVGSAACSCRRHIHPLFAPNLAAPRERTHTLQPLSDVASHTLHIQTLRKPRQPAVCTASATCPARLAAPAPARSSPSQRPSSLSCSHRLGFALPPPPHAMLRGCGA